MDDPTKCMKDTCWQYSDYTFLLQIFAKKYFHHKDVTRIVRLFWGAESTFLLQIFAKKYFHHKDVTRIVRLFWGAESINESIFCHMFFFVTLTEKILYLRSQVVICGPWKKPCFELPFVALQIQHFYFCFEYTPGNMKLSEVIGLAKKWLDPWSSRYAGLKKEKKKKKKKSKSH